MRAGGSSAPPEDRRADLLGMAVVLAVSLGLLMPFLRAMLGFGDEGVILHGAVRLLEGQRLYADYFEFLPPGVFLIGAGWFAATDVTLFAARCLTSLAIVAVSCLTYINCRRVGGGPALSAALVCCYAVAAHGGGSLHTSHHWFATFFAVILLSLALAFLDHARRPLLLACAAGLAGGAAAMVTPNRGAFALLAGLAAFAGVRGGVRAFFCYCAGAAIAPAAILAWLANVGSLDEAYQSVIVFALTRYAAVQDVPVGHGTSRGTAIILLMLPLAALLFVCVVAALRRAALRDAPLHTCAAFAVTATLAIWVRPDIFKLIVIGPLVLPLIALGIARLPWPLLGRRPVVLWGFTGLLMFPSGLEYARAAAIVLGTETTATPRGGLRFAGVNHGDHAGIIRLVSDLPAGDRVFFYPYLPLMAFLTARSHPAPVDLFVPNYTTPAQYAWTCREVLTRADWAVVDTSYDAIMAAIFPHPSGYAPPERVRFEAALRDRFAPVARVGAYEVMRRMPGGDDNACAGIDAP